MKNINVKTLLIILLFTFSISNIFAQEKKTTSVDISIDKNFVIKIMPTNTLKNSYSIDISDIEFKSEETLEKFCEMFSLDLHTLKGNFYEKKILLSFDNTKLNNRNLTVLDINNYFKEISNRMSYIYKLLNK